MSMAYAFGSAFRLDIDRLLLSHDGESVQLGPKVVETLLALVECRGEVLAKADLLVRIWPEGYVEEQNLAQNIYVLRKTLRTLGAIDPIETVPRRGYRFTLPVQLVDDSVPLQAPAQPRTRRYALIAGAVAFACSCAIFVAGFALAHRPAQLSPNGERLYAIGRYYWDMRSAVGVQRSIGYFEQVVRSDPRDARGYAGLAEAYAIAGDYHYGKLSPDEDFARARAFASRALAVDPNFGEAHAAIALVDMDGRKPAEAMTEIRRAIELDPNFGPAHEWYGIALVQEGRLEEAYAQLEIAGRLDPLSVATTAWLARAAYLDHRYEDAIAYAHQALDLAPGNHEAAATLAQALDAARRLGSN
jgi:DNA-binding winged helix-turn-helix (wHTH) protein/Flp pilus assembly protein TadD